MQTGCCAGVLPRVFCPRSGCSRTDSRFLPITRGSCWPTAFNGCSIFVEMKPIFFATPAAFRRWLEKNHDTSKELWVGFYKKDSGKASITWPESVDQALCFGWIDGVRKSVAPDSYMIRFTPRKPASIWSAVNTKRAKELRKQGLMHEAGLQSFERRDMKKTQQYSFERDN